MFKEKESSKHRLAKNLLYKWLTDSERSREFIWPFVWRPGYGVFKEMRFFESSKPYYFEESEGLVEVGKVGFEAGFDRGKILFAPDICVFHQGVAAILIEVVHRHRVSDQKLEVIKSFYGDTPFELYEIDAEEILRHTKVPRKLTCRLLN